MEPEHDKNNTPQNEQAAEAFEALHFEHGEQRFKSVEAGNELAREHWSRELEYAYNQTVTDLATDALIAGTKHENRSVQLQSVSALGQRDEPGVVTAVTAFAHAESTYLPEQAVTALERIGSTEAVGALADLLEHPDYTTRTDASQALRRFALAADADPSFLVDKVRDAYATAVSLIGSKPAAHDRVHTGQVS